MNCEACTMHQHDNCEGSFCNCDECLAYWKCVASLDEERLLNNGGEKMSNQLNLNDYGSGGDSVKMGVLDDKPSFTIVGIERSDYEDNLGIKFQTRESFDGANRFHTTRVAIVSKFYNKDGTPTQLTTAILAGGELKVKVEKTKFKNGKEGYTLAQA